MKVYVVSKVHSFDRGLVELKVVDSVDKAEKFIKEREKDLDYLYDYYEYEVE